MEKYNPSEQSQSYQSSGSNPQQNQFTKNSDFEGGSVYNDPVAVECMERLKLSEPSQKLDMCPNTNWQHLEMLVATL